MPRKPFKINKKQIFLIGALIVTAFLMMDLNNRLTTLYRLSDSRSNLETEVGKLVFTQQALDQKLAYATSDGAVEDWARGEGHMSKPGDVVIIPLPPKDSTPQPVTIPTPVTHPVKNWNVWQALFFGE